MINSNESLMYRFFHHILTAYISISRAVTTYNPWLSLTRFLLAPNIARGRFL